MRPAHLEHSSASVRGIGRQPDQAAPSSPCIRIAGSIGLDRMKSGTVIAPIPASRRHGLCRVCLTLFLLFALEACGQSGPSRTSLSSDPVIRGIQQHAIPIRTTTPGGSDADLAALKRMVGNATVVGLGEESHGSHELIDLKARLVEYLISYRGFTTLVMENDWGSSQLLDKYINGGQGDLKTIMASSLFGAWQTREFEELFAWLRAYNANPAHAHKAHFMGMDIQAFDQSELDTVESYVNAIDPQQSALVNSLYQPIIANDYTPSMYARMSASAKQQCQVQAQQVYNLLEANQQRYSSTSSPQQFSLVLQNARIIVETATYLNASTGYQSLVNYYQRDTFMAENVEWIYEHDAGIAPRVMVWAHDGHIANDTTYSTQNGRNLGAELRIQYQRSYLAIGTILYQGTFRAYKNYPLNSVQRIPPPSRNDLSYSLSRAGIPLYMLDLRNLRSGQVSNWAQSPCIVPNYGLGGQDLSGIAAPSQFFDVIVYIQKTRPSEYFYAS